MPNIILIGMTGSGKSTIGKELAQRLNLSFIDMDTYIEEKAKKSIPEIFEEGEDIFRAMETESCRELAKATDSVISTGGGTVVRTENHYWLRQAGIIVWIDRPLERIAADIDTANRPLLKDGADTLNRLYNERRPLYAKLADLSVKNDDSLEQTVLSIISQLETFELKGGPS